MAIVEMKETELVPTGEYPVQITNTEEEEGQWGMQVKLTCEILAGDYKGTQRFVWIKPSSSLKSKMAKWANACGLMLEEGVAFNTDWFQGRQCVAVIISQMKEDGVTEYNKITDLKPIPPKKAKAGAATAQAGGYTPPPQAITFDAPDNLVNPLGLKPAPAVDPFEEE
jgi:hypothetical protein